VNMGTFSRAGYKGNGALDRVVCIVSNELCDLKAMNRQIEEQRRFTVKISTMLSCVERIILTIILIGGA